MTAITSTAYSRDLGDELRDLRESCTGLHGRAMAIHLGWDPSKVSNIEHGKVRASEVDLVQILTLCGKDLHFLEDFRDRYRLAFEPNIVQNPSNLRTIAMAESSAKTITAYDVMTVHGLLQTKRYAWELFKDTDIEAPEDIENCVEARIARQSVLRRPKPPKIRFFLHELALQVLLGSAQVMEDQYLQLLFHTHILRLVPEHYKTPAFQSKCTLYEFEKAEPMVYTESHVAQVFAQDSAAVKRGRRLFERLDAVALDEEQSRSKLAEYVSALREDPHDPGTDLA